MDYQRKLARELRRGGVSEPTAARIVRDVHEHGDLAQTDSRSLEAEFGAPATYAKRFTNERRLTLGEKLQITAGIALLAMIAWTLSPLPIRDEAGTPLAPALITGVMVVAIVVAARYYDLRIPKNEHESTPTSMSVTEPRDRTP